MLIIEPENMLRCLLNQMFQRTLAVRLVGLERIFENDESRKSPREAIGAAETW